MINDQGVEVYGEVYKRTNRVNGKVYIGQTTRPDCGTVVFKRASGQRDETDMYFEAIQE